MGLRLLCLAVLGACCCCCIEGAQTFGVSLKGQGFYCGHETTVFTRLCAEHESPCAMQHVREPDMSPRHHHPKTCLTTGAYV